MNKSLFELQVIYFKLCNSPGTFQKIMNSIFQELLYKEVLVNYMDNFVIPAKTKKNSRKEQFGFSRLQRNTICVSNS